MIIKNVNVFQEDGSFCRETLYIRNHRLTEAFEETSEEEVIDADGLMVIPGLVDIHSLGAYGEDFSVSIWKDRFWILLRRAHMWKNGSQNRMQIL